ncbi:major facilitator superfamily domain-containing protein [Boletus reticuloceps]|uniref:Major facilitator superfamily domain-containing protein n=1 Tax=Boletus reticuloceps TaxID=495285 RepID=A0A8I2YZP8_9AGAM|nr:major facilitator superfamily domain-containing protein [Boletus reticuloceps]
MSNDEGEGIQVIHSEKALLNRGDKTASEPASSEPSTEQSESGTQLQDFPEGGWSGWATAIGAFLVQFSTYGYSISFGVYQDFYAQTYITNETASTIAWIGSTNAFLFEICGLVAGRLYDRGYFYHLLYGASLLQAFSLFMLSLARPDNYYQVFLTQGIGSGCAAGLLYVPSMAVLSHYFNKRREQLMTFASSGAYLGAVVHPIMLNNTINGQLGFANGVRASAGFVSGLLLIACLLMRTRLPPSDFRTNFLAAAEKCGKDSAFIFGCLGLCIFVVAFYYPLFYLQLDAVRHDLGDTFSFYSLVIMNTASFVGQLSSTVLVVYFHVPTMLIMATFCCSVIILGMIGVHTVAGFVVFGVLYGYFAGIFLALWTPVMALLTPDLSELGVRMGIACAAMAIGGLVGPPISGALLTPAYVWWRGAVFNGIAGAIGCTMFIVMQRILIRRSKAKAKN